MKSLLIVATIAIGGFSGNNYKNEMGVATEIITDKNLPVTTYVLNNMSTYNQARISEGYSATSLSFVKSCPIKTVEGEFIRGELVKFEDGYIVAGEDDEIHALSFINDVEINTNNEGVNRQSIAYFDIGGFREYDTGSKTWQHLEIVKEETAGTLLYDGQFYDGCGWIYDVDAFVDDKYGTSADFITQKTITAPLGNLNPLYKYHRDLSLYTKLKSDGTYYYEALPPFDVAFIICDYLDKCFSTSYYPRDALIDYDVSTQDLTSYYQDMIDNGYVPTNRQVSTLEAALRAKAFSMFGTVELSGASQALELVAGFDTIGHYPYTPCVYDEGILNNYVSEIKEELDGNNIGLFTFTDSDSYGSNFAAAATGYKYYKKVSSFIGIKVTTHIWIIEIRDGLCSVPTYFDATAGTNMVKMYFYEI